MRAVLLVSILALTLASKGQEADITLNQAKAQADARIGAIWPTARDAITTCLNTRDDCYTTWSSGSSTTLCNTAPADANDCQMVQVDNGAPDSCGRITGNYTFASYGITLPATDLLSYIMNAYSGPHGKGVQACFRIKYNGVIYEQCKAAGPQAGDFNSNWTAIQYLIGAF